MKIKAVGLLDGNNFIGKSNRKKVRSKNSKKRLLLFPERRKNPRVSLQIPVFYQVLDDEKQWGYARSLDAASQGMRLELKRKLEVGTNIEMDAKFPHNKNMVTVIARVVWIKPSKKGNSKFECGVMFKEIKRVSRKDRIFSVIADKHCRLALQYTKNKNYTVKPVETLDELNTVYRLLYREYLERHYCKEHHSQMLYNEYSVIPDTRTFMLKKNDTLVGTISLIGDSPMGVPLESFIPDKIWQLRKEGQRLVEVGFLALDSKMFKRSVYSLSNLEKQACLFYLFKIMFDCAQVSFKATTLILGVHPKHERLYRYLGIEPLGEARAYKGACGNPALPMCMDIPHVVACQWNADHGPGKYFLNDKIPPELLESSFQWTPDLAKEYLMEKRDVWSTLSPKKKQYLQACYGEPLIVHS